MRVRRFGAVIGGVIVGAFAFAGVADAHVTVNPDAATQGGYGRFAFRCRPRATPCRPPRSTSTWT